MTPKNTVARHDARRALVDVAFLTVLMVLTSASEAWAYIDPGTGSYLFQLLIAGGLAGVYTVRRYWHSLKATLARFGRADSQDPPTPNGVE
jgi:hypothetical protein